ELAMAFAAAQPGRLEHHDPGGEADRECREKDVKRDDEGELQASEEYGVEVHAVSSRSGEGLRAVARGLVLTRCERRRSGARRVSPGLDRSTMASSPTGNARGAG